MGILPSASRVSWCDDDDDKKKKKMKRLNNFLFSGLQRDNFRSINLRNNFLIEDLSLRHSIPSEQQTYEEVENPLKLYQITINLLETVELSRLL